MHADTEGDSIVSSNLSSWQYRDRLEYYKIQGDERTY